MKKKRIRETPREYYFWESIYHVNKPRVIDETRERARKKNTH